jgi:two-component system sensor histidine kinase BaeS
MTRRPGLARQVTVVAAAAVVVAVLVAGLVSLGLVRRAYDGQARAVLHREALLAAELAGSPGTTTAVRPARPAGRLLAGTGVEVVQVGPRGREVGTASARVTLDAADRQAAAAGQALQTTRTLAGSRWFVDVEPVAGGGGVVLLQRVSDARAPTAGVLRRLLLALVAGLAVAALLAAALARRLARPLVTVAGAAHRLAAGERDVVVRPDGPREIAEVAAALDNLTRALSVSEGRQRAFLLSIGHELRSPLTAVRGFAEAVADGVATGPEAQQAGRTIVAEAGRLQRLVDDLLDLARLRADTFRLEPAPVDLDGLVADAAHVWQQRAAAAGVPLAVQRPGYPMVAVTDAARVRQVLDGLVDNALRLTPAGRPVVVAVDGRDRAGVVLQVRDGGPGLTDDDLTVAFEPSVLHERYRSTRPVGTGVGLALVAGLVERLGGTVTAGHAPEGGAAFTVRLPAG